MYRANTRLQRDVAAVFRDWGIPTVDALRQARDVAPDIPLIASGGITNGLDVAKAIALGGDLCGIARRLLPAAQASAQLVSLAVTTIISQLRVAMFAAGARNVKMLSETPLVQSERTVFSYERPNL